MTEIVLEPASNGVVKKIVNSNYGGSEDIFETTYVYELDDKKNRFEYIKKFIFELCEDLTIDTGNKFDREVLSIDTTWGNSYNPSNEEISKRISELEAEINLLKEWQK